jgi:hypothetical protein
MSLPDERQFTYDLPNPSSYTDTSSFGDQGSNAPAIASNGDGKPIEQSAVTFPDFINDIERFINGFVSGSGARKTAMPQSQICVDSVKEGIAAAFTMLRINKPEDVPELAAEYTRLTKALNVAYAYCEIASYVTAYADLFGDLGIEDAIMLNEELNLGDVGVEDGSTTDPSTESTTPAES